MHGLQGKSLVAASAHIRVPPVGETRCRCGWLTEMIGCARNLKASQLSVPGFKFKFFSICLFLAVGLDPTSLVGSRLAWTLGHQSTCHLDSSGQT